MAKRRFEEIAGPKKFFRVLIFAGDSTMIRALPIDIPFTFRKYLNELINYKPQK